MPAPPDAVALVRGILDHPADALRRLVFADWLDELGGASNTAWASYLRAQAELGTLPDEQRCSDLIELTTLAGPIIRARLTLSVPDERGFHPPPAPRLRLGSTSPSRGEVTDTAALFTSPREGEVGSAAERARREGVAIAIQTVSDLRHWPFLRLLDILPAANVTIRLKDAVIPRPVIELVPESVARENVVFPVGYSPHHNALAFATPTPDNHAAVAPLGFILDKRIVLFHGESNEVIDAIGRHYGYHETDYMDSPGPPYPP